MAWELLDHKSSNMEELNLSCNTLLNNVTKNRISSLVEKTLDELS